MINNPKVSICIPTYNGALYLKECLLSAFQQTYKNIEIVISDDNSNDNTIQLIKKLSLEYNTEVNIYKNEERGIGRNWNNTIKKAKGDFIKFLFQDDLLEHNCIEEFVKHISYENKEYSIIASQRYIIGNETKPNLIWKKKYSHLQKKLKSDKNGNHILTSKYFKSPHFLEAPSNVVGEPSAIMVKKSLFKKVGYFNENYKQILDYEFYYRALKTYNILILKNKLVSFRLHEHQATNINSKNKVNERVEYFNDTVFKEFKLFLSYKQRLKHFIKKLTK